VSSGMIRSIRSDEPKLFSHKLRNASMSADVSDC
jgi:hypothetical protein